VTEPTALPPEVARTIEAWHAMVAAADLSGVESLLRPDAEFSSPAAWKPYVGAERVAHVLQTAISIFSDFAYHRQFATPDGRHVVLEFSARVGESELKGIDMIAFDAAGLVERFEVMIRGMKSLAAVAERMRDALNLELLGSN
jgi:2,4-dienoyl-CoA reductase (NADPH2)